MQKVTWDHTFENVRKGLLDEIKATEKRIHSVHSTTFNSSMQNKIDLAKQILCLMERNPKMTVKDLMYLIECRIEGEKIVLSSYRWSVEMDQEHFDNRDLEMLKFLIWHEGMEQWQD